jgi:ribosome-associated translation inhibitor RaiA
MATRQNVFSNTSSIAQKLNQLVQDQLSSVQRKQTRCRPDIDDLVSVVDILSATAVTCKSVLSNVHAQSQGPDPYTVIENRLPFSRDRHIGKGHPVFIPDLNVPFDLEFWFSVSVSDFAEMLAKHFNKTKKERETGEKLETCFLSLSAILEWTIHTTGQK